MFPAYTALVRALTISVVIGATCGNGKMWKQEYYTDAEFICIFKSSASSSLTHQSPSQVYWLLPNGKLRDSATSINDHLSLETDMLTSTSVIKIKRISDADFGMYYCIIVYNHSNLSVHSFGLNVDGASYETLARRHAANAVVGGIAAAAMLVVIVVGYTTWYHCCSDGARRRRRPLAPDLARGEDRFSTQIYDNVGCDLYIKKGTGHKEGPHT